MVALSSIAGGGSGGGGGGGAAPVAFSMLTDAVSTARRKLAMDMADYNEVFGEMLSNFGTYDFSAFTTAALLYADATARSALLADTDIMDYLEENERYQADVRNDEGGLASIIHADGYENPTSATYTALGSSDFGGFSRDFRAVCMSNDGAALYAVMDDGEVYYCSLSTPWDISTLSYETKADNNYFDNGDFATDSQYGYSAIITRCWFDVTGEKFYITTNTQRLYALNTNGSLNPENWRWANAGDDVYTGSDSDANHLYQDGSFTSQDGRRHYYCSNTDFFVWDIETPGDFNTAVKRDAVTASAMSPAPLAIAVSIDERYVLYLDNGDDLHLMEASTPGDFTTLSRIGEETSGISGMANPYGLWVSRDGKSALAVDSGTASQLWHIDLTQV